MSTHIANPTLYSVQEIQNESFNDTYKIAERAMYGYDSATDKFYPQAAVRAFDYIGFSGSATTDVLSYKTGGAGGTTAYTLTITYTDSSKQTIASIAKS